VGTNSQAASGAKRNNFLVSEQGKEKNNRKRGRKMVVICKSGLREPKRGNQKKREKKLAHGDQGKLSNYRSTQGLRGKQPESRTKA